MNLMMPWGCHLVVVLVLSGCMLVSPAIRKEDEFQNDLRAFLSRYSFESGIYQEDDNFEKALDEYNEELRKQIHSSTVASWNYMTNINDRTAKQMETKSMEMANWNKKAVEELNKYYPSRPLFKNEKYVRMLNLIHDSGVSPTPKNHHKLEKMTHLESEMTNIYATSKVTMPDGEILALDPGLEAVMEDVSSDNIANLEAAWKGWRRKVGPPMRAKYAEYIELANEAARENGFDDMGQYWRLASYEMDELEPIVDNLWNNGLKEFYQYIVAYVRRRFRVLFPELNLGIRDPLPAYMMGNMWAQEWNSLKSLLLPYKDVKDYDITQAMLEQDYDQMKMFRTAEDFFTSIGLDPMTDTFWEKTMMEQIEGREVECHGSAEDFYDKQCEDFRIKMCTSIDQNDLKTVHHEMGHIQYFMLYCHQPTVFRDGANAAFHEAVGDAISISVMTPEHLKSIGLIREDTRRQIVRDLEEEDDITDSGSEEKKRDINFLMSMALEKIPLLPFALVVDKWRWNVFNGNISPEEYNEAWWELRLEYQGVAPPDGWLEENHDGFDPGAKYHVAANVPYIRYFLSFVLQFQFHQALCEICGQSGALHKCDIYNCTAAGDKLKEVLGLGKSQPWPDTLNDFTGTSDFDPFSLLYYFQDLIEWLKVTIPKEELGWTIPSVRTFDDQIDEGEGEEIARIIDTESDTSDQANEDEHDRIVHTSADLDGDGQ